MKKIILIISLILVAALLATVLVACNNATPQGQLANILNDHNHEFFQYKVSDSANDDEGVYTVRLDAYKKGDVVSFNGGELTDVQDGILISGELRMGETVYTTGCYFNLIASSTSYMLPAYSFRVQKVGETETFRMQGTYTGKNNFHYERQINGGEKEEGNVKFSGSLYFDNNEFQQSLRTITTFGDGLNISFGMPLVSPNEVGSVTLSAAMTAHTLVKTPFSDGIEKYKEDGINCYEIALTRSTQVAQQKHHTLYYAQEDLLAPNSDYPNVFALKNVLVKIVEPYKGADGEFYEIVYELVSASLS